MIAGHAWRTLGRELRSGELRLLFAALAIAVAAVTAVGFFADRVRLALEREAQQMMGGDLILIADHALPEAYAAEARRRGLKLAETLIFPSMVIGPEQAQLADIKAVSPGYPLRGRVEISADEDQPGAPAEGGPATGSVWLDERLSAALQVAPGGSVTVGAQTLQVAAILTREPDRGVNFFSLAPRLMMHVDDIPATGLIQPGARIRYSLLAAGEAKAVAGYQTWLTRRLDRGERLEDTRNARPEIRGALDRAERFLGLSTVLTVVLAAVAAAMAARRYMQRHLDACAVMRCLGMTQGGLLRLHGWLFLWLALLAAVVGSIVGYAAHFVLIHWLSALLVLELPVPGWLPLVGGLGVAGVLLFGFAFPPLMQLASVPTLRVMRRELGPPQASSLSGYALGLALLAGLIIWVAGDIRLGAYAVGGFVVALGSFWVIARLIIAAIARLRGGAGFGWRQGLASLTRHASSSAVQIVALAIGLMAMLLLTVIRAELLDAWQQSVPVDAPNRFVINIQPDQRQPVADMLRASGVEAELLPMIRARLVRIAGREVSPASFPEDERAQRLIEREFNLSWRGDLPAGNRVTAGRWFAPEDAGQGLASVEEGLAKTLGIQLGDELVFMVAGVEKRVKTSNLRKLSWDSMRVNFFVLTPPGVIEDAPASYITSFHLPAERADAASDLVRRFPGLTMIDVGAILHQLQAVIGQVAGAVQFVFVFALLAGGIVLYSALLTSFDERRYELAVMRSLGAQRAQLRQAMLVELGVIGSVAGLMAAIGAMLLGRIVGQQAFQLDLSFGLWLPALSTVGGGLLAVVIGWLAIRQLIATPPLLALRNGA
ncbi:ABC transporter permease [Ferribacterium limneticum]|uniref:ABC transporter permease n=1 Tax=Ferribacterium limneticum TaxID=76259 RepID=UPI001CFBC411|nr:FtsX-like permease family protein [Ferribacterium limneticum]